MLIASHVSKKPFRAFMKHRHMFKALIIEDSQIFRRTLRGALCSRFPHMVVDEAADGPEARQKIDAFQPNLIFMDIRLPGENGLELTKKIKKDYPKMIIIILTNYDIPEYRQAAYEYGANYFLTKDASIRDELLALVESIASDLGFELESKKG